MADVRWLKAQVTRAKKEVAKWTRLEDANRRNFRPSQADGCKRTCLKWIDILKQTREELKAAQDEIRN